jgi:tripartite-type tricarboxylate transporter receptor subunit TctC
LPHVKAGRLRALAVTAAKRAEQLPNVPTVIESGIPDFEVTVWQGYAVPKGTSKAHITNIHAAMIKALAVPELKQRFFDNGVAAAPLSPEEFMKFVNAETARWQKVVALSGARVE